MKIIKNIDNLIKDFSPLSEDEKRNLIGGNDFLDKLFAQTFDFSASNLSAGQIDVFKKEVAELASTSVGYQMLTGLYNANCDKIHVTGDMPHGGFSAAEYVKSSNSIYLGKLDTNTKDEFYNEAFNFASISHEVFHAYLGSVIYSGYATNGSEKYLKDQRSEIDATMFAYMASVEYDIGHNLALDDTASHTRGAISLVVDAPVTESQIAIKTAWNDIFFNGNFTKENYNIIETNFNTGTNYRAENGKSTNPIDNIITDTNIYYAFTNSEGFVHDTKLFKSMMDNRQSKPDDIIKANPGMTKVASPNVITPSSDGGSGGGGGGGEYTPQDGTGNTFNWPGTGSGFGNPNGNGGNGGISDKTGLSWGYDDRYPGYSRSE